MNEEMQYTCIPLMISLVSWACDAFSWGVVSTGGESPN